MIAVLLICLLAFAACLFDDSLSLNTLYMIVTIPTVAHESFLTSLVNFSVEYSSTSRAGVSPIEIACRDAKSQQALCSGPYLPTRMIMVGVSKLRTALDLL